MEQVRKVAVVLQARMNSTRVPNKMVRGFAGSNLFNIALRTLDQTNIPKEDIFIAIGEKELEGIADNYEFQRIGRSQESCDSTNNPNVPDSLKLLYEWYQLLQDRGYTHVILVNPCHPLLRSETIDNFYTKYNNVDLKGLFSVTANKNYYWDEFGEPITDWKGNKLMNSKKVDITYEAAHCLYGSKLSFINDELWMDDNYPPRPELFVIDKLEAVDIDTEEDFEIAEVLYKNFNNE